MKKRLFCLLLSMALIFGLLPTAFVSAATIPTYMDHVVRLTGLNLTGDVNYTNTAGDAVSADAATTDILDSGEGWQWISSTKTLTLSGAYILCQEDTTGLLLPDGATIVAEEGTTNVIRSADRNPTAENDPNTGIWSQGALQITGTGYLTVAAGVTTSMSNSSMGIFLQNEESSLQVSGIHLTVVSKDTSTMHSVGVYSDYADITIASGSMTVYAGNSTAGGNTFGIQTGGLVSVEGGALTAFAGTAAWNSTGVNAAGGIAVNGGILYAKGGKAYESTGQSYGISAFSNMTMNNPAVPETNDGIVYAFGGPAAISGGISLFGPGGNLYVYGGTLMAGGTQGTLSSTGAHVEGGTSLIGGTTILQADVASPEAHATNIAPTFGGSDVAIVTPVGLPPGELAIDKPFNVYAPAGEMVQRTGNLDLTAASTQGDAETDGYHWDAATKTLTLSGLCLATVQADGILLPAGSIVTTMEDTMNIIKITAAFGGYTNALYSAGAVDFSGSGTLLALGGYTSFWSRGIMAASGDLNVLSGDVVACGGDGYISSGMMTGAGKLNISGGNVIAMGGSTIGDNTSAGGYSQGIRGDDGVDLSGTANVLALGSEALIDSVGIATGLGNISITSPNTLAISSASSNQSEAIYAMGNISLSGENMTVLSGGADKDSWGIYAEHDDELIPSGEVLVDGGHLQVLAASGTNHSYGILTEWEVIQNGGTIVSMSGGSNMSNGLSYGIYALGSSVFKEGLCMGLGATAAKSYGINSALQQQGAVLIGCGGADSKESAGITGLDQTYFAGSNTWSVGGASTTSSIGMTTTLSGILVYGGTINAIGGKTGGTYSYGIQTSQPIQFNNGHITAKTLDTGALCAALSKEPDLSGGTVTLREGSYSGSHALYIGTCQVTFDSRGGTAVGSATTDCKTTVASPTAPTRTGYAFSGWYREAVCTNAWTFATDKVMEPMTLYAKWIPNTYTIKFNDNGVTTGSMANMAMTYDVAKNLTAIGFKKTGFAFLGWAKTSTGSVAYKDKASVKNLTAVNKATVNLYAKWGAPITSAASYNYNSIKVSWAYAGGATSYKIYRATSATGTYSLVKTAASTSRSWIDTGRVTGKTYYYKIYPVAGGTTYKFSTYKSAKAIPGTPAVKVVKASPTSIKVTWSGVTGATKYQIYRAGKSSSASTYADYKLVYTASSTARSWTDTGRTVGSTYKYKVRAYHLEGTTKVYGGFSEVQYLKL